MLTRHVTGRGSRIGILTVFSMLVFSASSGAAPLDITLNPYPDIFANINSVGYDPLTDLLTVTGTTVTKRLTSAGPTPLATSFSLNARVNDFGVQSGAGDFKVGPTSGTQLVQSTSLLGFGYNTMGGLLNLQFIFGSPTGSYVPTYYPSTSNVGILVSGISGFTSWTQTWNATSSSSDVADIGTIATPEPSSLTLLLLGAGGLVRAVRKRTSKASTASLA